MAKVSMEEIRDKGMKPCPFCGSEGVIYMYEYSGYDLPTFRAECSNIRCTAKLASVDTADEAKQMWNTRCNDGEMQ